MSIFYSSIIGGEEKLYDDDEYHHVVQLRILKEVPNFDLNKFIHLEQLTVEYFLDKDIDLSKLSKLKILSVKIKNNITIILPLYLETFLVKEFSSENRELNSMNLINYENIRNISMRHNINFHLTQRINSNIDFNKFNNLEKIELFNINTVNKEIIKLSNENLYYVSIDVIESKIINLEECKNINFLILSDIDNISTIFLPKKSDKLETLILYNRFTSKENLQDVEIQNLHNNHNIKYFKLNLNTKDKIDFSKFKYLNKLSLDGIDINNSLDISQNLNLNYLSLDGIDIKDSLDISQNLNLKQLFLNNCKLTYIDFPYNFDLNYNSVFPNFNTYSNKKVICRRRIFLLSETKGHVEDVCENEVSTQKGLREKEAFEEKTIESKQSFKCFKCKKNIFLCNKLNIRRIVYDVCQNFECSFNYITCC